MPSKRSYYKYWEPEDDDNAKDKCPICKTKLTNPDTWPQMGTHGYTKVYKCGTEEDCAIGKDNGIVGKACDGSIKRFELPKITPEARKRFKEYIIQGDIR